ncbi:MAG: hypothetical protein MHPSP_004526, partial [Paramarteilia canceri]
MSSMLSISQNHNSGYNTVPNAGKLNQPDLDKSQRVGINFFEQNRLTTILSAAAY